MKYIMIAGLLFCLVFGVFWTMIIAAKRADKRMKELMQTGEN